MFHVHIVPSDVGGDKPGVCTAVQISFIIIWQRDADSKIQHVGKLLLNSS